jgi:hypothetical protein
MTKRSFTDIHKDQLQTHLDGVADALSRLQNRYFRFRSSLGRDTTKDPATPIIANLFARLLELEELIKND